MPDAWRRDAESAWIEVVPGVTLEGAGDPDENGVRGDICIAAVGHTEGWDAEERVFRGVVAFDEVPPPSGLSVKSATPALVDLGGAPSRSWIVEHYSLEEVQARAFAALAAKRWEATQFFTYDGCRTQADKAVSVVNGRLTLRAEAGIPDEAEMGFKLCDGEFRKWNRAAEVAFGIAIATHIQGCFDLEDQATDAIAAAERPEDVAAALASVTFPS